MSWNFMQPQIRTYEEFNYSSLTCKKYTTYFFPPLKCQEEKITEDIIKI